MRVLNSQQMREADRRTIDERGVPSAVLMENAGREVVAAMDVAYPGLAAMRIAVICGCGNNGGDGFVVSRILHERGLQVSTYLMGASADVQGDARLMMRSLEDSGGKVEEIADTAAWEWHDTDVLGADLIVDALFGTGLARPLTGLAERIVADVNASGRPVVAVDLPSGLSGDSAEIIGPAIRASLTVAFAAPKLPLVLPPAQALAGELVVADIGIPRDVIAGVNGPNFEVLDASTLRGLIPPRRRDSHKGTYGRVLIVAGSRGKTGAAYLSAMAALRSGAGLVTVATPASCLPTVAALGAEFMTEPLPETPEGTVAAEAVERVLGLAADVIAIGPGLGQSPPTVTFVQAVVARSTATLVIDADGLNAFTGKASLLASRKGADVVVTPHPGEMARLTGLSIQDVQQRRIEVARDFAASHRVHVVLKGDRTVIATPAGGIFINPTGNPGMATGGTGDVLTGVIAGWIGQLHDAGRATSLAVYLHGLAGDLAAAAEGETALIAGDLLTRLGAAVTALTGRRGKAVTPP
jgi:NAD(P)H-hydrate epimerase